MVETGGGKDGSDQSSPWLTRATPLSTSHGVVLGSLLPHVKWGWGRKNSSYIYIVVKVK